MLCVSESQDHLFLIKEAHASSCGGHFGTIKTLHNLHHHFYWPSLQQQVEKFIWDCTLCSQSKPSIWKHILYQPLPVPSKPWDTIPQPPPYKELYRMRLKNKNKCVVRNPMLHCDKHSRIFQRDDHFPMLQCKEHPPIPKCDKPIPT